MKTCFTILSLLFVPYLAAQPNNNMPPLPDQAPPAPEMPIMSSEKSTMVIDAHNRAIDYKEAYEILRKEKTANRIIFHLANGETVSNLLDIVVATNGSLLICKSNTPQGIKYYVIPVENIVSLTHQ